MSLASLVASSPTMTRYVMSHVPPGALDRLSPPFARRVLAEALTRTKAYPAFLEENGIERPSLAWEDFHDLPLTSKRSYLDRYSLADRCVGGDLHKMYVVERSSGVGGGCYYWPRLPGQDDELVTQIDMGMRMFFHVDRIPTLMISTFALGTWVGGVKMAALLRAFAMTSKCPVTVITPGVNVEETLQIVRDLSPAYGQTIMFGYPPFIKTVLDEGTARGMDWPSYNIHLGTGGEGFPEEWRDSVVRRLGHDPDHDLYEIMSGYGAADLGNGVGQEYPLTVLIRRLCMEDAELCRDLFGHDTAPNVFQYNPASAYVEEVDGELVFTVSAAIPLVRYAIKDAGGVLPFERVMTVLGDHGIDIAAGLAERGYDSGDLWRLPFLYCYGRADGTVCVGGANLYPENLTALLAEAGDTEITGYKLLVRDERLVIMLEHKSGSLTDERMASLEKRYHQLVVEGLQRVNTEYRDQFLANPRVADPVIEMHAAGTGPFQADVGRLKRRYTVQGHPEAA